MAYRQTHQISLQIENLGTATYTVHVIPTNLTDHIVDYKYSGKQNGMDFVNNPTNRPGYDVVAAINGGAYNEGSSQPITSLQIRGSNWNMTEYAGEVNYDSNLRGVSIVGNRLKQTFITGLDQHSLSTKPDMLRGGYRFGFIKNADGTYQVDFAEGSSAANAQTLYNDIGYRVGIGFKNSSADFIFVEEDITGDILRRLIAYLDYDSYVNLDGGRSSFMFDDGEVIEHWNARQIKDCFFLMKKRTNTVDITGWGLVVRDVGLNIRSAPTSAATKLGTVPIGGELKIKSFIPGFRSDGYQWAEVYYNGIEGYSQIDTYNCYTVEKTSTSMIEPSTGGTAKLETLYLVTSSSGAYARDAVVTGNRKFIPANTYLHIVEMLPGFQSDGYQWAKVRFYDEDLNETVDRFVQMDTYNWHYFYSE